MKIEPYVDKLSSSHEFREFRKKYDDSFIVAGFFILDFEMGKNLHQIDYFIPSKKKIAAFTLDGKITLQILDAMNEKIPQKLDMATKIDLDALQGILEDEMKNRSITERIKKIIAIVQNIDGKKIWNLNCVLSGMEILKAHVEDETKSVLKMEKLAITDYLQKVPVDSLKTMAKPSSKEEIEDEMSKLNKLEAQIEKEKTELSKQLQKSPVKESAKKVKSSKKN